MTDLHLTRRGSSAAPGTLRGAVLWLHGGQESSYRPVTARSATWLRSAAMQRALDPALREAKIASWLLRFDRRGWNGGAPIADARAALDHAASALPGVDIVVLGHSMGGRTAAQVADHPAVRGVVALAPWFPAGEPTSALRGKRLIAAHGSSDRITSAKATRVFVDRANADGCDARFVDAGPVGHYMFGRARNWNEIALRSCLELLDV